MTPGDAADPKPPPEEPHGDPSRAPRARLGPRQFLHPVQPYLAVLALGALVAAVLAAYLWSYREEILRIISQSPT